MKHPLTDITILTVAALAAMLTSAQAQTSSQQGKVNSPDEVARTRQVIASASVDSLRFTSLGELLRMRLEVIGGRSISLCCYGQRCFHATNENAGDRQLA